MKRFFALLLATLMLLAACGPVADDTTTPTVTDAPVESNEPVQTDDATPTDTTEAVDTTPVETLPPEPVERFDHKIDVKEDTYVLNKNGGTSYLDTNFGTETEIHVKSNAGSLTRYGFLKFDISSLKGDNDFTAIELELVLSTRQKDVAAPFAVIEVYGTDIQWGEETITFNDQPDVFARIATNDQIGPDSGFVATFAITDYVRQALAAGQSEIALYLKETTPGVALHVRFWTRESDKTGPKLAVYYGTKTDDTKYEGQTMTKGIEMSKTGIDTIIGWHKVENVKIPVIEDTYVEGSTGSVYKNFGDSDVIENKAIAPNGSTGSYRISLLKFDISDIKDDNFSTVHLAFNVFEMEQSSQPRVINVYSCDPYSWQEDEVTFATIGEKEWLITSATIVGNGLKLIDITDSIKEARKYGDKEIAFWLEGESTSMYRTRIDSREKVGGVAPYLNVAYGDTSFTTKIEYKGENPWDVAMEVVNTWFKRWEEIKAHGRNDAQLIVKDPEEYSIIVDAAKSSKADGANTVYDQYPTRNVSTLKGYKANTSETAKYDVYGGLMDESMKQEATGYFYTKKIGDRWWNIDPLGYPFYRTSVVCTTSGGSARQKSAVLAKYGSKEGWANATSERLFELGFNSVGGWSEIAVLSKADTPVSQTQIFNVATQYGNSIGVKVSAGGTRLPEADVIPAFDPGFATYTDERIKTLVAPYVNDPSVYGWMSDNELADNLNMLDHALNLDTTDHRRAYTYAVAWTFMYLKTGKANVSLADVTNELRNEYLAMTYDKYFEVVTTALDKYDPNHMYMGCRFVNNNYKREYIMRVAGYWCDVVTFNYYGAWEGDPTLLNNIGNWLGDTPFVVTEWYTKGMDVTEKDPLMVNKTGAGWVVRNQSERGKFYQNYALMLMECQHCVGFDWFRYWDNDPLDTGADASNIDSNKGVYDNEANEYTDLTKYMKELNTQKYNIIKFFDAR